MKRRGVFEENHPHSQWLCSSFAVCTRPLSFEISRMNVDGAPIAQLLHEQKIACILDEKSAEYEAQSNARREALTAAATEAARQKEREARQSGRAILTPRMLFEVPQEDLPLEQVLEKVFHAADEDKEGQAE
ncbi:hypothetical protein TGMAS_362300 [Toxoplasma gondii MAS]|uniref:Uncharacterized protein n=1 Tax=Toxoplasma gondii MAS TaxID=943118 RepID=A0A086PI53_TOXGO|nr:hypothetical protein TGMAS_362300 [Toxoplasma gondii MAS]